MTRLTEIDPQTYSDEQRRVHAEIARLRDGAVRGPFAVWIRLPAVADHANRLGDALRRTGHLPLRLYRLAALVVARHWDAHYAWHVHAERGIEAGLDAATVEAIRDRKPPDFVRADERAAFAVVSELIETRSLSADTYDAAVAVLGEDGLAALVGVAGFFTMAGMTLAAFDVPAPGGERPLP